MSASVPGYPRLRTKQLLAVTPAALIVGAACSLILFAILAPAELLS